MSPHPGTSSVDVQKYIGSCLIAQQPRSKRKPIPHGPSYHHMKPDCGFHYLPPCNGCYYGNYAWAGVPLITVAGHHKTGRINPQDHVDGRDMEEVLPISRLAIHAQGAPLIISPKEDTLKDCYYVEGPVGYFSKSFRATSNYLEEDLSMARAMSSSPSQSDCISTTSEESCSFEIQRHLPRIIKPRKRRKKDRRASDSESSCGSTDLPESSSIVTLKPYQPLCYSYRSYPKPRLSNGYPYFPSPRCRCSYCAPPPSTFLTPPDSPVSGDGMYISRPGGRSPPIWDNAFIRDCMEENTMRNPKALILTSSHPPQRPWITMTDEEPQSPCTFTVMCYNILCDKYATRQMYGYCPNWALDWSYRKTHILQELLHYKADIISLQEVETEQFYSYFQKELEIEGYEGIFSPKSRAKTMSEGERKHVDGCAIFYKSNKFTLVRQHLMEFNQLAMANAEGCDDMLNRVMTKDNIGLAALLQTKLGAYQNGTDPSQANQHLLVCTAHIHWDPEYSDVKLIQTMMLMHELKTFVDDILQKSNVPTQQKSDPNLIPLLLCGDFNSLPESGVIEYLSTGRVSSRHCDFREFVYKGCLAKIGNSSKSNEFTHPFQISRAYNDGIMPFTNYSYDFKGVIDYVFYSRLHMSVLGVLGPIDGNWLHENRIQGCPHPHIPSDHFPIVVELQLHPAPQIHLPPHNNPNGLIIHR